MSKLSEEISSLTKEHPAITGIFVLAVVIFLAVLFNELSNGEPTTLDAQSIAIREKAMLNETYSVLVSSWTSRGDIMIRVSNNIIQELLTGIILPTKDKVALMKQNEGGLTMDEAVEMMKQLNQKLEELEPVMKDYTYTNPNCEESKTILLRAISKMNESDSYFIDGDRDKAQEKWSEAEDHLEAIIPSFEKCQQE